MAHVTKLKAGAVASMVGHYNREAERRGYERENIDPEQIGLNYAVGAETPDDLATAVRGRVSEAVASHERESGKALRKDANVLCDWVVTAPRDLPEERQADFFRAVVEHIQSRYGSENVPGGFVHMDETRPHVHVPVVPVRDGRLVASKVINRADLKTFHGDLRKSVDAALGMHVSIELDEQQKGEKQLSALSQSEYIAAKDEIAATKTRLEHLQREVEELEPVAQTVDESLRTLWTDRNDGRREKVLAGEIEGLRSALSASEGKCECLREREQELERGLPALRERHRELGERFEVLRQQVMVAISHLREVPNVLSNLAQDIANKLGKRSYNPRSLDYMARQAREAAKRQAPSRGRNISHKTR